MSQKSRCWAVVPAAGVGRRMENATPKQYLLLNSRPVIEYSLEPLLAHSKIAGVYVAVAPEDEWWESTACANHPRVVRVSGGAERCHSVLNALLLLQQSAEESDWVLVHDAARPCLRQEDLDILMDRLHDHPVGGLLGVPVRDTMKRIDASGRVRETVAREGFWHAFTPQMFRFGLLHQALEDAVSKRLPISDDALAMELAGHAPLMVEGHDDNLKITRPEDLLLASYYLEAQANSRSTPVA